MDRRTFLAGTAVGLASLALGTVGHNLLSGQKDLRDSILNNSFPLSFQPLNLQSSFEGRIRSLLTCRFDPQLYTQELEAMSNYFEAPITLFTDQKLEHRLDRVDVVNLDTQYSGWIRDQLLVGEDGLATNVAAHSTNATTNKARAKYAAQIRQTLTYLKQELGFPVSSVPFLFEGGQVLKTNKHTLLPDILQDERTMPFRTGNFNHYSPEEIYEEMCGPTLFLPNSIGGGGALLAGHIDEYVTVLDKDLVAVADISLGNKIIRDLSSQQRVEYEQTINETLQECQKRFKSPELPWVNLQVSTRNTKMQNVFDATAKVLEDHYKVIRMPFITTDNNTQAHRTLFLSYNNAIVEKDREKCAFPVYNLPILDQAAKEVFSTAGYKNPLEVPSGEAMLTWGAVHCNYVERRV